MNRIKRERAKKVELSNAIKSLQETLPVYSKEDLRRKQLPYHEAVFCELKEKGFPNTVDFLNQLIEFQEKQREESGPQSIVWSRPRLKECKANLDELVDGICKAETAHYEDNIKTECEEFIKLACTYAYSNSAWWWLGEQLIVQSESIASTYKGDGGRLKAITKYMHGKFILENSELMVKATKYFEYSRTLSAGMPWYANNFFPAHKNSLFEETCLVLYSCYYEQAKNMLKTMPGNAAKFAMLAKKRATEACFPEGVIEAQLLKSITDLVCGDLKSAVSSILWAFKTQLKNEGLYDPRIKIAMDKLRAGKTVSGLENLMVLKDSINIKGLPYFIAQTYRYLGEMKLAKGEPMEATPLLTMALNLFTEEGLWQEVEQVRNLAAISAGQELMPKYTDLIIRTQRKGLEGMENLLKLMRWKDIREPFWTDEEASLPTGDSKSFEDQWDDISYSPPSEKSLVELTVEEEFEGEELVQVEESVAETLDTVTSSWFDDSAFNVLLSNASSLIELHKNEEAITTDLSTYTSKIQETSEYSTQNVETQNAETENAEPQNAETQNEETQNMETENVKTENGETPNV